MIMASTSVLQAESLGSIPSRSIENKRFDPYSFRQLGKLLSNDRFWVEVKI